MKVFDWPARHLRELLVVTLVLAALDALLIFAPAWVSAAVLIGVLMGVLIAVLVTLGR